MADSYLTFTDFPIPPTRKTKILSVDSTSGAHLGTIMWFGRWRCYCFFPAPTTTFNTGCLADIQAKLDELTTDHRANVKARST